MFSGGSKGNTGKKRVKHITYTFSENWLISFSCFFAWSQGLINFKKQVVLDFFGRILKFSKVLPKMAPKYDFSNSLKDFVISFVQNDVKWKLMFCFNFPFKPMIGNIFVVKL